VCEVAQVLVGTAKIEVDLIKATKKIPDGEFLLASRDGRLLTNGKKP
jgi:hypothetical protein